MIVAKVSDIDFGTIPRSRGDITKIENYSQLMECIDILRGVICNSINCNLKCIRSRILDVFDTSLNDKIDGEEDKEYEITKDQYDRLPIHDNDNPEDVTNEAGPLEMLGKIGYGVVTINSHIINLL